MPSRKQVACPSYPSIHLTSIPRIQPLSPYSVLANLQKSRFSNQKPQFEDIAIGLDDIDDFGSSPPRPRSLAFSTPSTPRGGPYNPPSSTTTPHDNLQTPTATASNKRPRFHDDIDPDLLVASLGKKAKKNITPMNRLSQLIPSVPRAGRKPAVVKLTTPASGWTQSRFCESLVPSSSNKPSQFQIDPDLLALALPIRKPTGKPNRTFPSSSVAANKQVSTTPDQGQRPWSTSHEPTPPPATKPPTSRYERFPPSPSGQHHSQSNILPSLTAEVTQFNDSFESVPQQVSYAKTPATYEIVPESSPPSPSGQRSRPQFNTTPPPFHPTGSAPQGIIQQQKRAAPITPSPKSSVDSIEDPESDSQLKRSEPRSKRQKLHGEDFGIDSNSGSGPARSRHRKPAVPKTFEDISTSGDEIPDPEAMDVGAGNKPPTPSQTSKSIGLTSKRFLFKTSKTTTRSPTPPGHINVRKHHKNIIPRTPTPPPGSPPAPKSWFVPKGLAETTRNWKEKAHGSISLQSEGSRNPPPKSFRITVQEFMKDEKMVIVRGLGESGEESEGVVKAMLTGKAGHSVKKVGCVVRYEKPWFPIRLFGEEEPYRCLIGPCDVVEPKDRDVHMSG